MGEKYCFMSPDILENVFSKCKKSWEVTGKQYNKLN